MGVIINWIDEQNIKPFLSVLASFASYKIDDDDFSAIFVGMKDTDYDNSIWFKYIFSGKHTINFGLAKNIGSSVIRLQIENINTELDCKINTAFEILQEYIVLSKY